MKIDVRKNEYAFRINDPSKYVKIRTPQWGRTVAESVSKGAYIVAGMKKNGDWDIQSVRIKRAGKSIDEAKVLAEKIIEKLNACE